MILAVARVLLSEGLSVNHNFTVLRTRDEGTIYISHACFNQEFLRSEILVRELTLHRDILVHSPFDLDIWTPSVSKYAS
jgi:hypothetical protein